MIVFENQNIFDLTIFGFGDLENLFDFLSANNLSLNSKLRSSQSVELLDSNKGKEDIKAFFNLGDIYPNNSQTESSNLPPVPGGSYSVSYGSAYS